jgi:hypothetical protein
MPSPEFIQSLMGLRTYYIVTACHKDDRTIWRRYPVAGEDIADAASIALNALDETWEIVKIKVLR